MACLEMYNSNGNNGGCGAPMSPRISFSNDFVEIRSEIKKSQNINTRTSSPLSKAEGSSGSSTCSDFEFSVSNYTMMPADELFSKGKLLPFKETNQVQRTLREELLAGEDEDQDQDQDQEEDSTNNVFSLRPPLFSSSSKGRWKGLLGLKKAHLGSKNNQERFVHVINNKHSQEGYGGREGSSCRDMKKSM